jgi:hypothetical protein
MKRYCLNYSTKGDCLRDEKKNEGQLFSVLVDSPFYCGVCFFAFNDLVLEMNCIQIDWYERIAFK